MQKEELRIRIKEYLKANNKPYDEDDIDNYIYVSAYNKLMVDMYGATPFDKVEKTTKTDKPSCNNTSSTSVSTTEVKSGSLLNGKIHITKR